MVLHSHSFPRATRFVLAIAAAVALAASVPYVGPANAGALLLVNVNSGKVLEGENATYPWYPASVTKLMTTYVTLKAVRDHRITLDSVFTVSPNAVAQQPSKMGFKSGTQLTVDNALKMLLVHSANDMAVVLAEGVSGSIEKFADDMNAAARQLGMTQTHYVNPNGLPDEGQITSARDLAILARALIREFPEYDYFWHIPSIRLGKRIYGNTNRLIDSYPGADGMKTGFICASGYNLVATATRGDRRLIAVVLGAQSSAARATLAAGLFERGFSPSLVSWFAPSRGTVNSLVPIDTTPPDLHEEICGNHRRRPATATAGAMSDDPQHAFLGLQVELTRATPNLTSGLAANIPPVDVFVGATRPILSSDAGTAAAPVAKKKSEVAAVRAAQPTKSAQTGKSTTKPPVETTPTAAKSTTGKTSAGKETAASTGAGEAKSKPAKTAAVKPKPQAHAKSEPAPKTEAQ